MSETKNKTTFWNFISNNTIQIPIIQRDYAQGRDGEEYLRKRFLAELRDALNGKPLQLDFVYGSVYELKNGAVFQPLDGQQRLTTLWLLHWYIALNAGQDVFKEACNNLKKFSYETRVSSREFCRNLCEPKNFSKYNGNDIVGFIENGTWFYSSWKQDPTIKSMLTMLKGTGKDKADGIEVVFEETTTKEFEEYWETLKRDDAPIEFYYLSLDNFQLSDDLYVKMNARGKQLTAFENFKADLIGYMREQNNSGEWEELLNEKNGIPHQMDTEWTDLFWKYKSNDNSIDEIYFIFLVRFFLNYKIEDIIEKENVYYTYLMGNGNENVIKYSSLDFFKWPDSDGSIDKKLFENLKRILDNYKDFVKDKGKDYVESILQNPYTNEKFHFVPVYKEGTQEVNSISQRERVVFYAVCKYFNEGEADEESLKHWMRVVWNIVSAREDDGDYSIRSISEINNAVKIIKGLRLSHNVYESLKDFDVNNVDDSNISKQLHEEIEKAKKILEDEPWETKIIDAESCAFFEGSIRFLFHNEKRETDWSNFETKLNNANRYFKKGENVTDIVVNDEYNIDGDRAKLLRALISRFTPQDFVNVIWKAQNEKGLRTFNNKLSTWLYYLLNDEICSPVHELLLGKTNTAYQDEDVDDEIKNIRGSAFTKNPLYQLVYTGLLEHVVKIQPESYIHYHHNGYKAIYQRAGGYPHVVYLNAEKRDKFLLETDGIEVIPAGESYVIDKYITQNKNGGTKLIYGRDIMFKYKKHLFKWFNYDHEKIGMIDSGFQRIPNTNGGHLEFNVNCRNEEICGKLDNLIEEYESQKSNTTEKVD